MNRTGLVIVLVIAAVVGGIFAAIPQLDLMLAALFYTGGFGGWVAAQSHWLHVARNLANWPVILIVAPAIIAVIVKLLLPHRPMLVSGRACILLISTLVLGPGFVTNTVLKDHWGRPRPFYVQEFGGPAQFVPWWDPRGSCETNCSFIAGEPAGAFWTMAAAAVAPPPWRAAAYSGAIVFGVAVGVVRMARGGHFASDVAFAGIFMFLIIWLGHGLLYRWRWSRLADATIERALERIGSPAHGAVTRIVARIRGKPSSQQDGKRTEPAAGQRYRP